MVSLFTQFVAGNMVEVPLVDPRVAGQVTTPEVVSQDDGPAVEVAAADAEVAPVIAMPASTLCEALLPTQASQ